MAIAHDAPEAAPAPRTERFGWAVDNPLVRTVGRLRLPLGAKLLIGFAVVGALLATGYVLGIVALGQSNSRGKELRRLQQQGGYEQLLLTDATQLKLLLDFRLARHRGHVALVPAHHPMNDHKRDQHEHR